MRGYHTTRTSNHSECLTVDRSSRPPGQCQCANATITCSNTPPDTLNGVGTTCQAVLTAVRIIQPRGLVDFRITRANPLAYWRVAIPVANLTYAGFNRVCWCFTLLVDRAPIHYAPKLPLVMEQSQSVDIDQVSVQSDSSIVFGWCCVSNMLRNTSAFETSVFGSYCHGRYCLPRSHRPRCRPTIYDAPSPRLHCPFSPFFFSSQGVCDVFFSLNCVSSSSPHH